MISVHNSPLINEEHHKLVLVGVVGIEISRRLLSRRGENEFTRRKKGDFSRDECVSVVSAARRKFLKITLDHDLQTRFPAVYVFVWAPSPSE